MYMYIYHLKILL